MLRNSRRRPIPSVVLCARIDRWIARGLCSEVQAYRGNLQALGRYEPHANDGKLPLMRHVGYDMETWNGNFRYQWDAPISTQDLVEYYAPPFQTCARDSNVGAFMCSYSESLEQLSVLKRNAANP